MDKRKEEIIKVALNRFCHYGFSKTTMNEVAEDLHITKANLYYYYQDKTALIVDVIRYVGEELQASEQKYLDNYSHDFLGTLFGVLEMRSQFFSKYYVLYINENLEWMRSNAVKELLEEFHSKELTNLKKFFAYAVSCGDVRIEDIDAAALGYLEVNKALGIMYNVEDIISGLPNKANVDKVLESQKRVAKLIFEDKIITK